MDSLLAQMSGISLNNEQRNIVSMDDLISAFNNVGVTNQTYVEPNVEDLNYKLKEILNTKQELINNTEKYKISLEKFEKYNGLNISDPETDCFFIPDITGFYFKAGDELRLISGRQVRTAAQRKAGIVLPEFVRVQVIHRRRGYPEPTTGDLLLYDDTFYVMFNGTRYGGGIEVIQGTINCKGQQKIRRPEQAYYIPPALRNQMVSFGKKRSSKKNSVVSELKKVNKLLKELSRFC